MKLTKKILAFVLVAAMLVTPWSTALATTYTTFSYVDSYEVEEGVNYEEYNVYGASSGHTEQVSVLEFHPDDGYIPMAFAASAGNVNVLSSQYSTAVNKYGYEVAGIINGSFFDTTTGTMEGILISGGKVSCADIGYTYGNLLDVVAFGYDGSMSIIESQLAYYMYINGELVPDALRFINKQQSSDSWRTDAIYYYDTSCGSIADSSTYGYEVVCKKQNGTDLVVGDTMVAEVIQINGYTSGSTIDSNSSIESDNFVLSTPSGSSYISYLTGLQVGDTVEITIEETVAESKEIMENASSVITNVGTLVKDGVDMTDYNSVIGTHYVSSTYARWTAFGIKEDGTYVFFTSEGGDTGDSSQSLTLKDVASAMISLGCTDVIRMDGGGSTAMYVSNTGYGSAGYMMSSSRSVADCIMIVKKTSDIALMEAIKEAEKISHKDYTAAELAEIRAAYENAKAVYASESSTDAAYEAAAEALSAAIAESSASADEKVTNGIYINNYNTPITAGASVIYTSDFNGGWISTTAANHNWSYNIICTWDDTVGAYVVTQASQGIGDETPTYQLLDNMIMIAVHNDETTADSIANFGLAAAAQVGQVINLYGVDVENRSLSVAPYVTITTPETEDPDNPVDPDEPIVPDEPENAIAAMGDGAIKAQKNNSTSDIRLIAYVDKLEDYSKVAFTLTMNGRTSKELECTTAYSTLYTNTNTVTTADIYNGKEGYFVTHTVKSFFDNITAGQEVTITVTYTKVNGETFACERTITFGTAVEPDEPDTPVVPDEPDPVPVTVTGNLTYANGYNWDDGSFHLNNVLVFASSDSTATPLSVAGQNTNFFQWWYGVVFEYDDTTETWKVISTDFANDAVNNVEATTLGDDRFVVVFHVSATGDNVDFLNEYAKEGAEFTLSTDIATLQAASGSLSNVSLSHTYYVPGEDDTTNPDDGDSPSVNPDQGGTTDPDQGGTTDPVDPYGVTSAQLTSLNYYQWVDSAPQANHIYAYASNNSAQTPYTMNGNYTLFKTGYGLVLQYNDSTGKYKVISVDYDTTDGTNSAEFQELSDGILVVLFGEEAATGQASSYSFLKENVVEGAEFYLSTKIEYIQYGNGATGSVSNLYLSSLPIEDKDDTTVEPADPVVGTVASTVTTYKSTGSCTRSSGDTDGLSAVLYAPSGSTGISTWLNLGAVDTTLYASDEAAAKQLIGTGTATDKDVDNAYLYLCMNSTYWSGDFGLIKRLGDEDWEIVTSEYFENDWRWNAYSYADKSGVTVSYDEDYVYWKYNVMDGREALYIKDCENIGDLQMNLISSGNTVTFSIVIGTKTVFSMSDSTTLSSLTLGRAASLTNSNETSYGSSNYLYQIASSMTGKTPATMTNVQFYDTYYYTSSSYGQLTISAGQLWIYPNSSSNAGYTKNANGDPIVTCEEVKLSDGRYMDIINFNNY